MKVIFCDFDGVLNNSKTPSSTNHEGLLLMSDPIMVFMLNLIVDRTDAKLVLSSSWRHDPTWRKTMSANGIVFDFLGRTPSLPNGPRSEEIRRWLKDNPQVTKYAVLDDDRDADLGDGSFFKTSWEIGLTQQIADEVEKYLT